MAGHGGGAFLSASEIRDQLRRRSLFVWKTRRREQIGHVRRKRADVAGNFDKSLALEYRAAMIAVRGPLADGKDYVGFE